MVMAESARRGLIRVGFYDIIETIGEGNFAVVKLARHRITKTEVAIKIIDKTRLDQTNLKKIYREIQILKLLRHQHIIKLYQTSTTIFLVCEYASHGEVFDYITREEKVPEEKARRMFYQVLCAIEYCHKNNVVHRDLKAENLLLDANDNIKLADFGFGNFFQSGQHLNTWCGSPPYAAPEVFEGKLYEGPQLDVWSLGVVLYVLVCGTFPFDGSNLTVLKERVLAGRFRIPFWMSQDCENLIRRMLVVNPKKRLTISQIKKHKWMQVFATKPEITLQKSDATTQRAAGMPEYNEHILKLIQSLGIDRQKTLESLRNSSYDHLYAVYHLLVDRLKQHRTSFPLESRMTYDASRRRPSNIADQTLTKFTATSPNVSPFQPDAVHKTQFFPTKRQPPPISPLTSFDDDVNHPELSQMVDKRFSEDLSQEVPQVQRTLALSPNNQPRLPQSPNAKPHFITTGGARTPLPHQPWSFHSGVRFSAYQRFSNPLGPTQRYRESGEGLPSVTSIDEGVELSDFTEEQSEMIRNSVQPRRHTLVVPDVTLYPPNMNLRTRDGGMETLNRSSGYVGGEVPSLNTFHRPTSYNDSLSSSAFSDPIENPEMHLSHTMCDVTPKVVLSPCPNEVPIMTSQGVDPRVAQIENQRQLLDVSPTGFREGRRASDGLLLLGDSRLCDHLRGLTRVQGFPTIKQEESDESYRESSDTESDHVTKPFQLNHLHVQQKPNEFGMMSSHSSQHVMKSNDVINYQPYASSYRRRSLQVSQQLGEGNSCSVTLNAPINNQSAAEQLTIFQQQYASSDVTDLEGPYQWSSWKTVKENEGGQGTGQSVSPTRHGNMSHLSRVYAAPFAVASDESMIRSATIEQAKRQPSLPSPTAHHLVGQQSLAQQLQQRRLKRRLKVAHNMQGSTSYQLPLSELQHLKIEGEFAQNTFPPSTNDLPSCQYADELLQGTTEPANNFPPVLNTLIPASFPFRTPSFDEQRAAQATHFETEFQPPSMEFTFT